MSELSVPKGGGALTGIGETFQPDLHTGTGNLSVPITLPPGRGSLTPTLSLSYSSGNGNGPFGLGWSLGTPRITRRTDRSVPVYDDDLDVFVLSGAEELAPVPLGTATPPDLPDGTGAHRYRPRTETTFARIVHVSGPSQDYWDVWAPDGLRSRYGTLRPTDAGNDWVDPAVIRTPEGAIFAWLLATSWDPLGNRIVYDYGDDQLGGAQRYLRTVRYGDYGDANDPAYAVTVGLSYDTRPDPFSDRKAGFDLRTALRATQIAITTVGSGASPATTVDLRYADQLRSTDGASDVSLLAAVTVTGHDAATGSTQALPPLTFTYRDWAPVSRRYVPLSTTLPAGALSAGMDLMDLFGDGLPSVVQLNSQARYWRNRGNGTFDRPRPFSTVPAGATLGTPGVTIADVDCDGRPEFAISAAGRTAVWGLVDNRGQAAFVHKSLPPAVSVGIDGPQTRLLDLDGDHIPDLVVGGDPALVAAGDGKGGYRSLRPLVETPPPLTDLANPRSVAADMSGDGLTDAVEVHDGSIRYWPNLGHGRFGSPISMSNSPRFADAGGYTGSGFDPRRLHFADVTGSGPADAVYVADGSVTVWLNRSGNGFASPVTVHGTPNVDDQTGIRLVDINGTGVAGVLWSGVGLNRSWAFLDLTGGVKPYLMTAVDNHRGATTTLDWSTSTAFASTDRTAGTPWQTTLPFPVHVLAGSTSRDHFAGTVLTTGYRYHDGYWDPIDREFRGFGCVEHWDTLAPIAASPPSAPLATPIDPLIRRQAIPAGFDAAAAGNLVDNWSFDTPASSGPSVLTTTPDAPSGAGNSAAERWTTWNNAPTTTHTELVPSTLPQGRGGSMIHVTTGAAGCGLVHTFGAAHTGPDRVTASAWIFLLTGSVVIGTGDGGDIAVDATVTETGRWIFVTAGNQRSPANEFVVYSGDTGGSEFYVDHAWLHEPEVPAEPIGGPPVRTVTWFHLGPVGPIEGPWQAADGEAGYWPQDPPLRPHLDLDALPAGLTRSALREALRAIRGQVLRTETYADDGDPVLADRPYEVHDSASEVVPVLDGRTSSDPSWLADPVVTVREVFSRQTQWDRGTEPMTRIQATGDFDEYGRAGAVATIGVPLGRDPRAGGESCLASVTTTRHATRDDATGYLLDRIAVSTRYEALDDGAGPVADFAASAVAGGANGELRGLDRSYYDGDPYVGLPVGQLGVHGLLVRTESLVLTPAQLAAVCAGAVPRGTTVAVPPYLASDGSPPPAEWPADYPAAFVDSVVTGPTQRGLHAGYTWRGGDEADSVPGYYATTKRLRYDVHTPRPGRAPRGLIFGLRDAYGGDTTYEWDALDFLLQRTTDPVGLVTEATYDYRLFKPQLITDANGNRTAIGYTPLGLLAQIANLGRATVSEGDTEEQPGLRFDYDLTAWDRAQQTSSDPQPMSVSTVRRVDHRATIVRREDESRQQAGKPPLTDAEIDALFGPTEETDHPDRFIRTVEYSDGFGRVLQTRTQADQVTVSDLGLPGDFSAAARVLHTDPARNGPTVVVSGWTRYDTKGHAVVIWEPAFDDGYDYRAIDEAELAQMAAVRQHYDARGRPTVRVAADGSWTWMVRGRPPEPGRPAAAMPTPWEVWTYDADDNAGRTHPTLSLDRAGHWNTPSTTHVDALGRAVRQVQRGLPSDIVTTSEFDIDGNVITMTDALGRLAAQSVYDCAGRAWSTWLLDAGCTRSFLDAAGGVLEHRDDNRALVLSAFDAAHRQTLCWAADRDIQAATLRTATIFGDDSAGSGRSHDDAAAENLLGRAVVTYDEAGRQATTSYDLDGNAVETTRSVLRPDLLVSDLPAVGRGSWAHTSYAVDWQPAQGQSLQAHAAQLLDPVEYATESSYDALHRVTLAHEPVDVTGRRAAISYTYSRGGGLARIAVDDDLVLQECIYDAHGRCVLRHLGNGVLIRYRYDPDTLQLRRVRAEHAVRSGDSWKCDGPALQDLVHRVDQLGTIVAIGDRTPGSGLPGPSVNQLNRFFDYDALGRLVGANGRETDTPSQLPWDSQPRSADVTKTHAYTERYSYDVLGNLIRLEHATDSHAVGAYTRQLPVVRGSNQLATLTIGQATTGYTYDACGNLISEATNRFFEWDHANRLSVFRDQAGTQVPSVYTQYRYDATGRRIIKLVRKSSGPDEIWLYLGGLERLLRGTVGGTVSAFDELRLTDHDTPLVSIQRGPATPGDGLADQPVRYYLADHLGSVTVTLGQDAGLLNREEYLPYGETSFGSYGRKRYRFTARERDDESGLSYHGARYYAPWLCRWTACDPLGISQKLATCAYSPSPLTVLDPDGRAESNWWSTSIAGVAQANSWLHEKSFAVGAALMNGVDKAADAAGITNPAVRGALGGAAAGVATLVSTGLEVAGGVLMTGPNMLAGLDASGTDIGEGAGRAWYGQNKSEQLRGALQLAGGVIAGAMLINQTLTMTKSWGTGTIDKAGPTSTVRENAAHGRRFETHLGSTRATPWRESSTHVTVRPNVAPGVPGTSADSFVIDRLEKSRITGSYDLVEGKGTATAQLTRNQQRGFPLFERFGGEVRGGNGGVLAPAGTQLPPSDIAVVRPLGLFLEQALPQSAVATARQAFRRPN